MIMTALLPLECRLLILLAHLHPDVCTAPRLTHALDATRAQVALAADTLITARYAARTGDRWTATAAGRLLVCHHLTAQATARRPKSRRNAA